MSTYFSILPSDAWTIFAYCISFSCKDADSSLTEKKNWNSKKSVIQNYLGKVKCWRKHNIYEAVFFFQSVIILTYSIKHKETIIFLLLKTFHSKQIKTTTHETKVKLNYKMIAKKKKNRIKYLKTYFYPRWLVILDFFVPIPNSISWCLEQLMMPQRSNSIKK